MLIGQAIAEVAADVLKPARMISAAERQVLQDALRQFSEFSPDVVNLLEAYFEKCVGGGSTDALAGCIAHCKRLFRKNALRIAIAIAEADGPITGARWQSLLRLAAKLELDPNVELRGKRPIEDAAPLIGGETCWAILELPPRASVREIKTAYRNQARRHHPDRLFNASAHVRGAAEERMKAVNAAFADALSIAARTPARSDDPPETARSRFQTGRTHSASKWVAVASRPPFADANANLFRRSRLSAGQKVRRAVFWLSVAIVAWIWFGFVTSTRPPYPPWWDDPLLCAIVVASATCLAALVGAPYGHGQRAAAWTLVLTGFVVLAGFWYRGLQSAMEYELKHPESTRSVPNRDDE
jgi:DnaJ-domain-containing protein 1